MNPSERIDQYIAETADWRGKTLAKVRKCVLAVDPEITEEWKWMGTPLWSRDGMIAIANAHKGKVKVTFSYGAKFSDPDKLFNGNDKGATRRSIDIFEDDKIDETALKNLVRAAIAYNQTNLKKNAPKSASAKSNKSKKQ